jgi:hypothetical protein
MNSRRKLGFCVLLMVGLTTIACAGRLSGTYGRIDSSREATLAFESYSVNPTYRYYISGSDVYPNALIGISRDYHLDPETLWKEVEMTPKLMKELVGQMKARASQFMQFPLGFNLVDDTGRVIGAWYSLMTARTFIEMKKDGIVRIDTPDIDTYNKFENDGGRGSGKNR